MSNIDVSVIATDPQQKLLEWISEAENGREVREQVALVAYVTDGDKPQRSLAKTILITYDFNIFARRKLFTAV